MGVLNNLSKKIYAANKKKGFWPKSNEPQRNVGELLMLVTSELGEALDAHRINKHTTPLGKGIINEKFEDFKEHIKDTFEDEIADAVIRLLDLCGGLGIDIEWHIKMKMKYNASRPFKHGKKY